MSDTVNKLLQLDIEVTNIDRLNLLATSIDNVARKFTGLNAVRESVNTFDYLEGAVNSLSHSLQKLEGVFHKVNQSIGSSGGGSASAFNQMAEAARKSEADIMAVAERMEQFNQRSRSSAEAVKTFGDALSQLGADAGKVKALDKLLQLNPQASINAGAVSRIQDYIANSFNGVKATLKQKEEEAVAVAIREGFIGGINEAQPGVKAALEQLNKINPQMNLGSGEELYRNLGKAIDEAFANGIEEGIPQIKAAENLIEKMAQEGALNIQQAFELITKAQNAKFQNNAQFQIPEHLPRFDSTTDAFNNLHQVVQQAMIEMASATEQATSATNKSLSSTEKITEEYSQQEIKSIKESVEAYRQAGEAAQQSARQAQETTQQKVKNTQETIKVNQEAVNEQRKAQEEETQSQDKSKAGVRSYAEAYEAALKRITAAQQEAAQREAVSNRKALEAMGNMDPKNGFFRQKAPSYFSTIKPDPDAGKYTANQLREVETLMRAAGAKIAQLGNEIKNAQANAFNITQSARGARDGQLRQYYFDQIKDLREFVKEKKELLRQAAEEQTNAFSKLNQMKEFNGSNTEAVKASPLTNMAYDMGLITAQQYAEATAKGFQKVGAAAGQMAQEAEQATHNVAQGAKQAEQETVKLAEDMMKAAQAAKAKSGGTDTTVVNLQASRQAWQGAAQTAQFASQQFNNAAHNASQAGQQAHQSGPNWQWAGESAWRAGQQANQAGQQAQQGAQSASHAAQQVGQSWQAASNGAGKALNEFADFTRVLDTARTALGDYLKTISHGLNKKYTEDQLTTVRNIISVQRQNAQVMLNEQSKYYAERRRLQQQEKDEKKASPNKLADPSTIIDLQNIEAALANAKARHDEYSGAVNIATAKLREMNSWNRSVGNSIDGLRSTILASIGVFMGLTGQVNLLDSGLHLFSRDLAVRQRAVSEFTGALVRLAVVGYAQLFIGIARVVATLPAFIAGIARVTVTMVEGAAAALKFAVGVGETLAMGAVRAAGAVVRLAAVVVDLVGILGRAVAAIAKFIASLVGGLVNAIGAVSSSIGGLVGNVTMLGGATNTMSKHADTATKSFEELKGSSEESGRGIGGALAGAAEKAKSALGTIIEKVNQVRDAMGTLTKVGAVGTVAAGFGIGKIAVSFDDARARFKSTLQEIDRTQANMDTFTEKAQEIGQKTAYSSEQAAEGMTEMIKKGMTLTQTLKASLPVAIAAEMNNKSIAETAEGATSVMDSFGISVDKFGNILNVMTKSGQISTLAFEDYKDLMNSLGPVGKVTGKSFEEVAGAASILRNQGINAAEAGIQLKEAMLLTLNPSKQAKEAMNEIGFSVKRQDGSYKSLYEQIVDVEHATQGMNKVDRDAALTKIFGTQGVLGFVGVLDAQKEVMVNGNKEVLKGSQLLKYYEQAYVNSAGTMEASHDIIRNTFGGAWRNLVGSVKEAAITIGDRFLPTAKGIIETSSDVVNSFIKWERANHVIGDAFNGLVTDGQRIGEFLMPIIGKLAEYAMAAFTRMVHTIRTVVDGFFTLKAALGGNWHDNEKIEPITAAIGRLGLALKPLADAFKKVFSGFDLGFIDKLLGLHIKEAEGLKDLNRLHQLHNHYIEDAHPITDALAGVVRNNLAPAFETVGMWIRNNGPQMISAIGTIIGNVVSSIGNGIRNIASLFGKISFGKNTGQAKQQLEDMGGAFKQLDSRIQNFNDKNNITGKIAEQIKANIDALHHSIGFVTQVYNEAAAASGKFGASSTGFFKLFQIFASFTKGGVVGGVIELIKYLATLDFSVAGISKTLKAFGIIAGDAFKQLFNAIGHLPVISNILDFFKIDKNIGTSLGHIFDGMGPAIGGLLDKFGQLGTGIKKAWDGLINFVQTNQYVQAALGGLAFLIGSLGENIINFAVQLPNYIGMIYRFIAPVTTAMNVLFHLIVAGASVIFETLGNLVSLLGAVLAWIQPAVDQFGTFFTGFIDGLATAYNWISRVFQVIMLGLNIAKEAADRAFNAIAGDGKPLHGLVQLLNGSFSIFGTVLGGVAAAAITLTTAVRVYTAVMSGVKAILAIGTVAYNALSAAIAGNSAVEYENKAAQALNIAMTMIGKGLRLAYAGAIWLLNSAVEGLTGSTLIQTAAEKTANATRAQAVQAAMAEVAATAENVTVKESELAATVGLTEATAANAAATDVASFSLKGWSVSAAAARLSTLTLSQGIMGIIPALGTLYLAYQTNFLGFGSAVDNLILKVTDFKNKLKEAAHGSADQFVEVKNGWEKVFGGGKLVNGAGQEFDIKGGESTQQAVERISKAQEQAAADTAKLNAQIDASVAKSGQAYITLGNKIYDVNHQLIGTIGGTKNFDQELQYLTGHANMSVQAFQSMSSGVSQSNQALLDGARNTQSMLDATQRQNAVIYGSTQYWQRYGQAYVEQNQKFQTATMSVDQLKDHIQTSNDTLQQAQQRIQMLTDAYSGSGKETEDYLNKVKELGESYAKSGGRSQEMLGQLQEAGTALANSDTGLQSYANSLVEAYTNQAAATKQVRDYTLALDDVEKKELAAAAAQKAMEDARAKQHSYVPMQYVDQGAKFSTPNFQGLAAGQQALEGLRVKEFEASLEAQHLSDNIKNMNNALSETQSAVSASQSNIDAIGQKYAYLGQSVSNLGLSFKDASSGQQTAINTVAQLGQAYQDAAKAVVDSGGKNQEAVDSLNKYHNALNTVAPDLSKYTDAIRDQANAGAAQKDKIADQALAIAQAGDAYKAATQKAADFQKQVADSTRELASEKSNLSKHGENIRESVESASPLNATIKAVQESEPALNNAVRNAMDNSAAEITNEAGKYHSNGVFTGSMATAGISEGLLSNLGQIQAAIGTISNTVSSGFASLMQIHSPSRVMAEHGKNVAAGVAVGITEGSNQVQSATQNLANTVQDNFSTMSTHAQGYYNMSEGANTATAAVNKLNNALANMTTKDAGNEGTSQNGYDYLNYQGGGGPAGGGGGAAGGGNNKKNIPKPKATKAPPAAPIDLSQFNGDLFQFVKGVNPAQVKALQETSDGIGKIADAAAKMGETLTKLKHYSGVSLQVVQQFGEDMITLVKVFAGQANEFNKIGAKTFQEYADASAKIADAASKFLDVFIKLKDYSKVSEENITAFVDNVRQLMAEFIASAVGYKAETVVAAQIFADTTGKVADAISKMADGLAKIRDWVGVADESVKGFVYNLTVMVQAFVEAAKGFDDKMLDSATQFSDAAGKIADTVGKGADSLAKLRDWVGVANESIEGFTYNLLVAVENFYNSSQYFKATMLKQAVDFSDAAGKVADTIGKGADALKKLLDWQGIANESLVGFAYNLRIAVEAFGQQFAESNKELVSKSNTFAETAGKVVDIIDKAVTAFARLQEFTAVSQQQIARFAADLGLLVAAFGAVGVQFNNSMLTAATGFAEAGDKVSAAVGAGVDAFSKLGDYKSPASGAISSFAGDLNAVVQEFVRAGQQYKEQMLTAAKTFAETAGAAAKAVADGVDGFIKLGSYVQPSKAAINALIQDLFYVTAQMGMAGLQMQGPMMQAAKTFADAAGAVFGAMKSALDVFDGLGKYTGRFPNKLRALLADMFVAVFLVGQMTLTIDKDMMARVKTFGESTNTLFGAMKSALDVFDQLGKLGNLPVQAVEDLMNKMLAVSAYAAGLATVANTQILIRAVIFAGGISFVVNVIKGAMDTIKQLEQYKDVPTSTIKTMLDGLSSAVGGFDNLVKLTGDMRDKSYQAEQNLNDGAQGILTGLKSMVDAQQSLVGSGADPEQMQKLMGDMLHFNPVNVGTYFNRNDNAWQGGGGGNDSWNYTSPEDSWNYRDPTTDKGSSSSSKDTSPATVADDIQKFLEDIDKINGYSKLAQDKLQQFKSDAQLIEKSFIEIANSLNLDKNGAEHLGEVSDAMGKSADALGRGLDAFAKINDYKKVNQAKVNEVMQALDSMEQIFLSYAKNSAYAKTSLESAGNLADSMGKVVDVIGKAVDGFAKLKDYRAPNVAQVLSVIAWMSATFNAFAPLAANPAYTKQILEGINNYADSVQKVAGAIKDAVDALTTVSNYKSFNPTAFLALIADIQTTVAQFTIMSANFSTDTVKATGDFADAVTKTSTGLKDALAFFKDLEAYIPEPIDVVQGIIDKIGSIFNMLGAAVPQFNQDSLKSISDFSDTVGRTMSGLKTALDFFIELPKFVRVPEDTIRQFVIELEQVFHKLINRLIPLQDFFPAIDKFGSGLEQTMKGLQESFIFLRSLVAYNGTDTAKIDRFIGDLFQAYGAIVTKLGSLDQSTIGKTDNLFKLISDTFTSFQSSLKVLYWISQAQTIPLTGLNALADQLTQALSVMNSLVAKSAEFKGGAQEFAANMLLAASAFASVASAFAAFGGTPTQNTALSNILGAIGGDSSPSTANNIASQPILSNSAQSSGNSTQSHAANANSTSNSNNNNQAPVVINQTISPTIIVNGDPEENSRAIKKFLAKEIKTAASKAVQGTYRGTN